MVLTSCSLSYVCRWPSLEKVRGQKQDRRERKGGREKKGSRNSNSGLRVRARFGSQFSTLKEEWISKRNRVAQNRSTSDLFCKGIGEKVEEIITFGQFLKWEALEASCFPFAYTIPDHTLRILKASKSVSELPTIGILKLWIWEMFGQLVWLRQLI